MADARRYWLRFRGLAWQEATSELYCDVERTCGFGTTSEGPATGSFSFGAIEGRTTYGEITEEEYGHDPEFFAVASARPSGEVSLVSRSTTLPDA